ncbi:MAG: hypothetical protein EZS28_051258, partial [Streblomastix strix]
YQFSVLIIPQDESTNNQFSKPNVSQTQKLPNKAQQNEIESTSNSLNNNSTPIQRISLRAICYVDEVVCVGLSYDGPGSDLMYDISEKMDETLINIPQMCQWGDQYICSIENGLENVWRGKQKNKQEETQSIREGEKVIIAKAQTFIFFEDNWNKFIRENYHLLDVILRVRHAAYTNRIHLQDFPFQSSDNKDHSFDNIASVYTITDTPEGVSLLTLNLNFTNQMMKLGQFAMIGLPCSTSRIIVLHDDNVQNSKQLANEIALQALQGAEQIDIGIVNNVKELNFLTALKGSKIIIDNEEQVDLIKSKKLQKHIRHQVIKSKMLSIHIKQNPLT